MPPRSRLAGAQQRERHARRHARGAGATGAPRRTAGARGRLSDRSAGQAVATPASGFARSLADAMRSSSAQQLVWTPTPARSYGGRVQHRRHAGRHRRHRREASGSGMRSPEQLVATLTRPSPQHPRRWRSAPTTLAIVTASIDHTAAPVGHSHGNAHRYVRARGQGAVQRPSVPTEGASSRPGTAASWSYGTRRPPTTSRRSSAFTVR